MVNLHTMKRLLPYIPILLFLVSCFTGIDGVEYAIFPALVPIAASLFGGGAAAGGAGAAAGGAGAAMGGANAGQVAAATYGAQKVSEGNILDDYMEGGQVNYNATPYTAPPNYYGGYEEAYIDQANIGQQGMFGAQANQDAFNAEAFRDRGPQAWENANLSNNEAWSRGYDQQGALQLAREAAMGNAPSEAAWQQQRGLDQAIAAQQSQIGGARGAAAIANAQGNAAGNIANLQNQAYSNAAQLRAQEMANARGQYGALAGQMREQDQARLGQANQMSQFNATNNDAYRTNMGTIGAQYGNQAADWYTKYQDPYKTQGILNGQANATNQTSHDTTQQTNAGIQASNAEAKVANRDKLIGMGGTFVSSMIGMGRDKDN